MRLMPISKGKLNVDIVDNVDRNRDRNNECHRNVTFKRKTDSFSHRTSMTVEQKR